MKSLHEATVCTVSYRNAPYIDLNREFTAHLNSEPQRLQWIVAENTPDGGDTLYHDARFQVIPGVPPQPLVTYHHAMALNRALQQSGTRFVVILDPDFYVVYPEWVDAVIDHMLSQDISFLGSTWNPRYSSKYRYFPTVHFFVADTNKIPVAELDFRPIIPNAPVDKFAVEPSLSRDILARTRLLKYLLHTPLRSRVRFHTDTGGRLYYGLAGSNKYRFECLTPVYPTDNDFRTTATWRAKLAEAILPDLLCFSPKRKATFRRKGFEEDGLLRAVSPHWDQFYWNDKPFGFHVRRNAGKQCRDAVSELSALRQQLHALSA
ncbi:MAG: hypothetical protein KDI01_08000 [Halioglobus sp.]|nr:hypothetical protein [Halioglobus sp.]